MLVNQVVGLAQNGLGAGAVDFALLAARVGAGSFFAFSGMNKLFNKGRHAGLVETLKADHVPAVGFNQWWVPGWEFVGGCSLVAGFFPSFMAAVLMVILAVACCSEGAKRVAAYAPINKADYVDDWLYLPEVIWMFPLAVVMLCGGGKFAVL